MNLAVFASGSGSNFEAIASAVSSGDLSASLGLVVTNRETAGVLDRAARHGVDSIVLDDRSFETTQNYCTALLAELEARQIDFIALAGYLRKIPEDVVNAFRGRMLNIHPSLLPSFGGPGMYGRRVHESVIASGVRYSGVTVHVVDLEYDTGPIVLQRVVDVHPDDDASTLASRVLSVEHAVYPEALQLFATNRAQVDGRRVLIKDPSPPNPDSNNR